MAVLSKTGITTGATIQVGHVTQSVDAFTGLVSYDITLSGSLTLTGSLNQSGSVRVSNAVTASSFTGSYTGSFTGNLSGVASSAVSSQILLGSSYLSGSAGTPNQPFRFIAGASKTGTSPNAVPISIAELDGKILGQTVFITATASGSAGTTSSISIVSFVPTPPVVTFGSSLPNLNFNYIIMYI
jgi:hypothetical protein